MNKEEILIFIEKYLIKHKNNITGLNYNKEIVNYLNKLFKNTEIENSTLPEKLFVFYKNNNIIPYCPMCKTKKLRFGSFSNGYSKHCYKCSKIISGNKSKEYNKKKHPKEVITKKCLQCNTSFSYEKGINNKTINKKFCSKNCATYYNYKHMSEETKQKTKEKRQKTDLERYGDINHINSKHCRQLTKEKLGVEYPLQCKDILNKTFISYKEKTGYENPFKNPEVIEKMKQTKIKKYGDLMKPTSHYKDFKFPSGKIVKIQGYEDITLKELLLRLDENDIIVGRKEIENYIGKIFFFDSKGIKRIYYPDIYVISENKIYETKCQFTYDKHKEINELKKQAILNKNIDFEFKIHHSKERKKYN